MWYAIAAGAVALVVSLAALVLYIKRSGASSAIIEQQNAALIESEKRRVEQERLDTNASKKRTEEFDAKVDAATTAAAANDVLRDALRNLNSN